MRDLDDGGVTWTRDPRIGAGPPIRLDRAQIEGFLRRVRCRTRLIRPTEGWPVPDAVLTFVQDAMPGLEIVELPGERHHVHLDRPDLVANHCGAWLRDGP